jgi:hypothetical protein
LENNFDRRCVNPEKQKRLKISESVQSTVKKAKSTASPGEGTSVSRAAQISPNAAVICVISLPGPSSAGVPD